MYSKVPGSTMFSQCQLDGTAYAELLLQSHLLSLFLLVVEVGAVGGFDRMLCHLCAVEVVGRTIEEEEEDLEEEAV